MPWSNWRKVILSGSNLKNESRAGLISKLQLAGLQDDAVEMYHGETESGDHIFVYSPRILEIAGDILLKADAAPYDGEPPLQSMRKLK